VSNWVLQPFLNDEERNEVLNLIDRRETQLGREPIDEQRKRIIIHQRRADHWLLKDDVGRVLEYAQVNEHNGPEGESVGISIDEHLLPKVCDHYGAVNWWIRDVTFPHRFQVVRSLLLMCTDLPGSEVSLPEGYTIETFSKSKSGEWIAHNNRAFQHHPEQGSWNEDDLDVRCNEPWFDPSGFLLIRYNNRIAASCWTKIHELSRQRRGEIYVISVDPQFQGHGLGRAVLSLGMQSLWRRGVNECMLFVDESNTAARHLYANANFELERTDQLVLLSANVQPNDQRRK
jgi:ribosomal protein S18 acetylase RimI-like enzyme